MVHNGDFPSSTLSGL